MPKVHHLTTDLWAFGRTTSRGFPMGFLERTLDELYHGGRLLHACCGKRIINDPDAINLDIKAPLGDTLRAPPYPELLQADVCSLPFKDATFAFTLCDPPYPGYDSQRLYGTGIPPLYTMLQEMSRVTQPNGQYALLYPYTPNTLGGDSKAREVAITLGVHQRPRILSVYTRGLFPGKASSQYLALSDRERTYTRPKRRPGPRLGVANHRSRRQP